MRLLLISILSLFISDSYSQQSVYGFTITTIAGTQHTMQEYQGERIWIVILPATQSTADSAFLSRIDSISIAWKGQFKTIAVPSIEEGYYSDSSNTLSQWYQAALDTSIIISQALYTHSSSDAQQDSFFSWLTHARQNSHFDFEVNGPGTMFFINEQGTLYSVFGTEARWSNKILNHAGQ